MIMPEEFQCPVCRAKQQLQPECRRCHADLTLLMRAVLALRDTQQQLKIAIAQNPNCDTAKTLRERLNWLSPKEAAAIE
jgi:hypothetical protein